MERQTQKNGLVNLAAAVIVFIAAVADTVFSSSLAGEGASVFLGVGALAAFASWFQMRLAENEGLEKLEVAEMARLRGETALFESKESELYPARRAREQFEKFLVPGIAVVLFILEGGAAWVLWRWTGESTLVIPSARAVPALSLFAIFGLVLFLIGRFSVTMAGLEDHRLLRPGASFLLAGAYMCCLAALAIAGVATQFPRADFWVARAFCVLLGIMAAETLLTLLLEIYRPRVQGKVARPLYDSRIAGILAQPETLLTTAAQTLDYQFGFKVSETWFYQLAKENLPALALAQFVVLILSTCIVFIEPGEQAIDEYFGKPVAVLSPGVHLKFPWPVDKVYRYRTDRIQSFTVGSQLTAQQQQENVILWSTPHGLEENFLVGFKPTAVIGGNDGTQSTLKAPPVSLVNLGIPVQFQITNVMDWAYKNADPTNLLDDLATRAVIDYLAGVDLLDFLTHGRLDAAVRLQGRIQAAADDRGLGVRILFVGLQDIHPPVPVAASFEDVIGAEQKMIAATNDATSEAIRTNALAGADAFADVNLAEADETQVETAAFATAALFTNQIPAFEAAPSVYEQRVYFNMFASATAQARKYVLLATNTDDSEVFDLRDTISQSLLNNLSAPK